MRTVIPAAASAVLILAGCGGSASPASHSSPGTAAAPAAATASGSCSSQILAWANAGGSQRLHGISKLLTMTGKAADKVARDVSAGNVTAEARNTLHLDVVTTVLRTAAKLALDHLPPSCAPALVSGYKTAMQDLIQASADFKAGNDTAAASEMQAAGNAIAAAAGSLP